MKRDFYVRALWDDEAKRCVCLDVETMDVAFRVPDQLSGHVLHDVFELVECV